jgi:hypothetical protein
VRSFGEWMDAEPAPVVEVVTEPVDLIGAKAPSVHLVQQISDTPPAFLPSRQASTFGDLWSDGLHIRYNNTYMTEKTKAPAASV